MTYTIRSSLGFSSPVTFYAMKCLYNLHGQCHSPPACLSLPLELLSMLPGSQHSPGLVCLPSTRSWRSFFEGVRWGQISSTSAEVFVSSKTVISLPVWLTLARLMCVPNKFFLFPSCLNPCCLYHWLPFSASHVDLAALEQVKPWKSWV